MFLHEVGCLFWDKVTVIVPLIRVSSSPTYGLAFTIRSHFSTLVVLQMHVRHGSASSLHSFEESESSSNVSVSDFSSPCPMHKSFSVLEPTSVGLYVVDDLPTGGDVAVGTAVAGAI